MRIESTLEAMGLTLPEALKDASGMRLPFAPVRVRGSRAFVSGHGPQNADGSLAEPSGKVGAEVTPEQAYALARQTGLTILAALKRELGDLDRVTAWLRVFGMVNAAPGFNRTPAVINGFSDLILELYGPEVGAHARSAIGVAELPLNIAVEIEAEVEIAP
jgi:enamine deaminase RidA (YjgF/YER057c/UK114 family)